MKVSEAYTKLGISKGTLYSLFEKPDLKYDLKLSAATILGSTVEDIFRQKFIDTGSFIGNMSKDNIVSEPDTISKNKKNLIPYYDIDIIAGTSSMYDDKPNNIPSYYLDVPQFTGCSAYTVYADSMYPVIEPGAIMFCRKIENWLMVLEFGQIYAIELKDRRRFLKYIRKGGDDNKYIMRSANDAYDDFEVPKSEISQIWLVEGWMRKKTQ